MLYVSSNVGFRRKNWQNRLHTMTGVPTRLCGTHRPLDVRHEHCALTSFKEKIGPREASFDTTLSCLLRAPRGITLSCLLPAPLATTLSCLLWAPLCTTLPCLLGHREISSGTTVSCLLRAPRGTTLSCLLPAPLYTTLSCLLCLL